MKFRSSTQRRFAWTAVALAATVAACGNTWALGLGRLNVQSALGESLKAEVDVTSIVPEEASTLRLRVASPEVYRAAGVDYNAVLSGVQVSLQRRADGRAVLRISSDRAVLEPFVDVIIEATWASGRLVREYTLLLDPPGARPAPPVMAVAPPSATVAAVPRPAPATPAPLSQPIPAAPSPVAPRPAAEPRRVAAAPAPAPAAAAAAAERVRVRPGDSLSRIAANAERPGVSLDQMLVALFRANPQAFMGDNMNRLKAGVVLDVPTLDAAKAIDEGQAREVIRAQSADFDAYRQRLASGVPAAQDEAPARVARGTVQSSVEDRRQGATPSPDQLRLLQGSAKPAPEAAPPRPAANQEVATRVAELSRNVEELKRLQQSVQTVAAVAPAREAAAAPTPAAPIAVVTPPLAAASMPAPAAAPMPAPAPAPLVVVQTPTPAPAASADEPGFLASLLDHPLVLPGAGLLIALLGGLGIYRLRQRMRRPAGETSFLESRLQPDSFFGASGGQRIDTREAAAAAGPASSMNYSLSQLDAIGDVDPVAEADVYLAYGRDLQAEEILKEAMRATPERMAIRTKLLEVYAKRRDSKAFELLGTQLFALTRGEGEDWAKAQEMGRVLDPENGLYKPGGQPEAVMMSGGRVIEPLGATTLPQTTTTALGSSITALPPTPSLQHLDSGLDLDLELDLDLSAPAPLSVESTQALTTDAAFSPHEPLDFDLESPPSSRPPSAPTPAPAPAPDSEPAPLQMLDFDFDSLPVDLEKPAPAESATLPPISDFGGLTLDGESTGSAGPISAFDDDQALGRKLELAEEFRQIGDTDGARELLEEVIAKVDDGALKSRAQAMLDRLA